VSFFLLDSPEQCKSCPHGKQTFTEEQCTMQCCKDSKPLLVLKRGN